MFKGVGHVLVRIFRVGQGLAAFGHKFEGPPPLGALDTFPYHDLYCPNVICHRLTYNNLSHWLPHFRCPPPHNPSSITSLVSHCVNEPSPLDEKLNDEADDLKKWIADFREQLKADRIKFIAELRKDFSLFKSS